MATWSDAAELVGNVAPYLGAALAGSPGYAIGATIAKRLGVENTPEAVMEKFRTDPETVFKLQQLEAEVEQTLINGRASIVQSEVNGENWLQRNWRPGLMVWFAILIGAHWLGFTAENLNEYFIERILDIMEIGIGGYVIGRSAEKITKSATGAGFMDFIKTKAKR